MTARLMCRLLGHRLMTYFCAVTCQPVTACSRCWRTVGGVR